MGFIGFEHFQTNKRRIALCVTKVMGVGTGVLGAKATLETC